MANHVATLGFALLGDAVVGIRAPASWDDIIEGPLIPDRQKVTNPLTWQDISAGPLVPTGVTS
jgi:hypothetical protein